MSCTTGRADKRGMSPSRSDAERLRDYMNAYWLRPENALWMTLRSMVLSRCPVRRPAIDLSCGDGVFSFLHAGGGLAPEFDVFTSVAQLERVTHEHADMFDCARDDYAPPVVRRAAWTFDVGTDLKPALLRKAAALGFYGRLVEHDSNAPLPLADESFEQVYSNSAYWVREVGALLSELRRIVRPGGSVVLHVKLAEMADYTLERYRERLGGRLLDLIGRGRRACWPTVCGRAEWERRFARAGLTIEAVETIATRTHAYVWDIGLRPVAPLLVRMSAALASETRAAIKRDWVDLMCDLLAPLCRPELDLAPGPAAPAELQYVLRRA